MLSFENIIKTSEVCSGNKIKYVYMLKVNTGVSHRLGWIFKKNKIKLSEQLFLQNSLTEPNQ